MNIIEAYFIYPLADIYQLAMITGFHPDKVKRTLTERGLPFKKVLPLHQRVKIVTVEPTGVIHVNRDKDNINVNLDSGDILGINSFAAKYKVTRAEAIRTFVAWGLETEEAKNG